jgi:hypothetical protein
MDISVVVPLYDEVESLPELNHMDKPRNGRKPFHIRDHTG